MLNLLPQEIADELDHLCAISKECNTAHDP